jgi:hypothetical protein
MHSRLKYFPQALLILKKTVKVPNQHHNKLHAKNASLTASRYKTKNKKKGKENKEENISTSN